MKLGDDYPSASKTYRVIIECLRKEIEDGRYKPGAKLPSEKELCALFAASRSSVREALCALEYIGLLEVRSGSGYYVTGNLPAATEDAIRCCATKMVVQIDPTWTVRSIRQLLEQGADGAVIAVSCCANDEWQKQLRAIRQAARDSCLAVPVIADIAADAGDEAAVLESVLRVKVDIICVHAQDENNVLNARQIIDDLDGGGIPLLAKLDGESQRLRQTVQATDGIVITPAFLEKVSPDTMQEIIGQCQFNGKLLMLAMREELTVTSGLAEQLIRRVIAYGIDGIILCTGGAAQKFPGNVLVRLRQLAKLAEENAAIHLEQRIGRVIASPMADALCQAAIQAARAMRAAAIIAPTSTGFTPRLLAKFQPAISIIAVSADDTVIRRLRLVRGVQPLFSRRTFYQEDSIELALKTALSARLLQEGDAVIAVCSNLDVPGIHSTIQLLVAGDIILRGQGIGNGIVTGRVALVKGIYDTSKRVKNKILVTKATDAAQMRLVEEAAGLIVEEGGLSSHAAVAGLSLGKPVIVGAAGATDVLVEDEQITMDVMRGVVYQGWVNLG